MKFIIDSSNNIGTMEFLHLSKDTDNCTRFHVIETDSIHSENKHEKFSVKLPFPIEECRKLNLIRGSPIAFSNLVGVAYVPSRAKVSWSADKIIRGDVKNEQI